MAIGAEYRAHSGLLRHVAFDIQPQEILGLAGQSGSGKSTIALAILRLLHLKGGSLRGQVRFRGRDLLTLPEKEMRGIRGREIALVLQNPISSLNPALRVGRQLDEAFRVHNPAPADIRDTAIRETLDAVSLPPENGLLRRYPAELSVGQAQRVLIAMSILHRPALLIADEPTSALDALTQSEILRLFVRLNQERSMAILYISHDLLSMACLAHRVAILHQGEIVECAPVRRLFQHPGHPATRRLIDAIPQPEFLEPPAPLAVASLPYSP